MKTARNSKKLKVRKESLRRLDDRHLHGVAGGAPTNKCLNDVSGGRSGDGSAQCIGA